MQISKTLKILSRPSLAAGLIVISTAAVSGTAVAGGAMPKEAGVWIDDTGKGAVKIEPCGAKLCGKIVWLKEPLNDQGLPKTDKHNPDPSKQTRPICGLPTLGALTAGPDGGFDGGWVYDPKEGKSYTVALDLAGPNQLQVTGYLGLRFLGKSFIWTRATGELPACTATAAATQPGLVPATSGMKPADKQTQDTKQPASKQTAEKLPWGDEKAKNSDAVKAAATKPAPIKTVPADASKLGAKGIVPAAKALPPPPVKKIIQQRPAAEPSN